MDNSQSIKIGARILDEEILLNLLPSYKNIKWQVHKFRLEAFEMNEKIKAEKKNEWTNKIRKEFGKHYDNIISILGRRGTGKTSALLTIRFEIMRENKDIESDIILPLIIPDHMSEISDTLGWIINFIGDEIDEIKKKHPSICNVETYDKYCNKDGKIGIEKKYDELQKAYLFRKKIYRDIVSEEYIGTKEYIEDNKKILKSDQELISRFKELITEIIDIKRDYNRKKKDDSDVENEPLIFIFFDDVDISAERCPEVLNTIMRYLTHPNIVVFVSGQYEIFLEALTIDFLKKEEVLKSGLENIDYVYSGNPIVEIENNSAIELRKIRSMEYLKKVLPPAFRYEMPVMNYEQVKNFRYFSKSLGNIIEVIDNVGELGRLSLHELIELNFYGKVGNSNSFLRFNNELILPYLDIFDNTPRGLISLYYYLYQKAYEKFTNVDNVWSYESIYKLLNIIVDSNPDLRKFDKIIDQYIYSTLSGSNQLSDFIWHIDYDYIETLFNNYQNETRVVIISEHSTKKTCKNKKNCSIKIVKEFITLNILGVFFENIFKLTNQDYTVKYREVKFNNPLSNFINELNANKNNLVPRISDVKKILSLYNYLTKDFIGQTMSNLFGEDDDLSAKK